MGQRSAHRSRCSQRVYRVVCQSRKSGRGSDRDNEASVQPTRGRRPTRMEKDLLGEKAVPADAYYGVQTARALENFQISGVQINRYPEFIEAWAIVKLAAARANTDVGAMKKETLDAIEKSAAAVRKGDYNNQFTVDWYQGGAGTSTNMNANEVMANVALGIDRPQEGRIRDRRTARPPEHVAIDERLLPDSNQSRIDSAQREADCRTGKARRFIPSQRRHLSIDIVKMGRTELQDAVPMTVGQEFHAFAASLEGEIAQAPRSGERVCIPKTWVRRQSAPD